MKGITHRVKEYSKTHKYLSEEEILSKAFENAKHCQYKSQYLVYERIRAIARMPNAYFITLTYDNKNIDSGSNEKAKKWAKKNLDYYYGNDDYGKTNGRYHHHIFGNFIKKGGLNESWPYGAVNVQKMRTNEKQVAKYIQRLTNHSKKDNTSKIFKSKRTGIIKCIWYDKETFKYFLHNAETIKAYKESNSES